MIGHNLSSIKKDRLKQLDLFFSTVILISCYYLLILPLYNTPGGGDDISHFADYKSFSFFEFMEHRYFKRDGRLTDLAFWSIVGDLPLRYHWVNVIINWGALLVTIMASYTVSKLFLDKFRLVFSCVFTIGVLNAIPQFSQYLYWLSSQGTYVYGTAAFLVLISRLLLNAKVMVFDLFLSFVAIGSNEILLIWTSGVWLVFVLFKLKLGVKNYWKKILSIVAFASICLFAPGNKVRANSEHSQHESKDFVQSLVIGAQDVFGIFDEYIITWDAFIFCVVLTLLFLTFKGVRSISWVEFLVVLILGFGLVWFSCFAIRYSLGVDRPIRLRGINTTVILIYFMLTFLMSFVSQFVRYRKEQLSWLSVSLFMFFPFVTKGNLKLIKEDIVTGVLQKRVELNQHNFRVLNASKGQDKVILKETNKLRVNSLVDTKGLEVPMWNRYLRRYYENEEITFE